ncbi:HTH and integrase core domain protein [Indivirus ILV1]|uniref:HTH and integrase core domain protein n=1 Tax=Indivirus ILV1 TaxID=1977633 RepID=A0A1V0SCG6_9VIRU|nr:HTH and integrase core domain protein [Indivirus ILV1]
MVNCYPLIYKIRVCEYYLQYKQEKSITEILKIFNISNGTLYSWVNKYTQGILNEKKPYNKKSIVTPEIKCYIRNYIMKHANFYYKNLLKSIKKKYNIQISKSLLYDIIGKMNITRKKFKQRIIPNKNKYKLMIKQFKNKIKGISQDDIISVDETSINTHISLDYGWSEKGTKIIKVHKKSRITYTVISAISNKSILHNVVIKGSSNAESFKQFIMKVVGNTNKPKYLLMDNARIHHSKIVKDYIDTTNSRIIYNVPYSPEYNPIEMIFSKVKRIIKTKNNSSDRILKNNIHKSFKKVTISDLKNCYFHSFSSF